MLTANAIPSPSCPPSVCLADVLTMRALYVRSTLAAVLTIRSTHRAAARSAQYPTSHDPPTQCWTHHAHRHLSAMRMLAMRSAYYPLYLNLRSAHNPLSRATWSVIESSRLLCSLFGARAHHALIMHMHAYSAHDQLTMASAHCLIIDSAVPHQLLVDVSNCVEN